MTRNEITPDPPGTWMKKTVLLILTLDTKGPEAVFLREVLERLGVHVLLMDVGIFPSPHCEGDIRRHEVALAGGLRTIERLVEANDKGEAIGTMIRGAAALTRSLYEQGRIHGVLSIGGAQGTLIGTTAMRTLPIGVPKVMLSTMASGNRPFAPYVGTADITLMHSVVDFFGLNPILKRMLSNAAGAVAGMLRAGTVRDGKKPRVAVTIYGTTTPAGMRIVSSLEDRGYDVVAFHPNGVGGMAMEGMIRDGMIDGVIDLTLHELTDERAGGDHAAQPGSPRGGFRPGDPPGGRPGKHRLHRDGTILRSQARLQETQDHGAQSGDDLRPALRPGDGVGGADRRREDESRDRQRRGGRSPDGILLSEP